MSVRVRYAPSPTGSPHVGNIRTALFCHLFARRHGGQNILRIEDTDRARLVPGCEDEIVESLRWVGVQIDEGFTVGGPHGPYRQSERAEQGVYEHAVSRLLKLGHAYYAFETPEELAEMREFQQVNKQPVGYFGGTWRDATPSQVGSAQEMGKAGVIRLKMPRGRKLVCQDAIRGRIEWDAGDHDDPVLIKADGMPTYHCAAMVDDHLMGITHVIRGEEWISSAPKHVWLYEALEWSPPVFVHVPVIKGKDGAKLSKRHGDTRCLDYRAAGYLPEALANFIALIGWSPGGDRELMTLREMEEAFDLDGLQPSPGVFDADKLRWMNGHYVRQCKDLGDRVQSYLEAPDTAPYWNDGDRRAEGVAPHLEALRVAFSKDPAYARATVELERERVVTLAEFGPATDFFLADTPVYDDKAVSKWLHEPHVPALLEALKGASLQLSSVEACEAWVRGYAAEHGFDKLGPVVHPLRVALTGRTVGPGLFELMALLGADRIAHRADAAMAQARAVGA